MEPVLRIENVSKIYKEHNCCVEAISDITFAIAPHSFLVLAGPSGSGKTTLLNLIGGLDRPTSGDISVAGVSLNGLDEGDLSLYRRKHVGFVFQGYNLLPTLTVIENVEFPLLLLGEPDSKETARKYLELVGLDSRAFSYPQDLSSGQQQRVAIARAVVHSPSIILADEPTANLDSKNASDIFDLLTRMNRTTGTSIILATHSPALIEKADVVIRLIDGKLLPAGSVREDIVQV
jgi:putative ABC transport system ATP-binding protein